MAALGLGFRAPDPTPSLSIGRRFKNPPLRPQRRVLRCRAQFCRSSQYARCGLYVPDFSLLDQDGSTVTLADLKGSKTIVYFYPKDDTPGCTVEACAFRDNLPRFTGAKVYGVSPDGFRSHKKFAGKFSLTFPLLADEKHALSEACGVWVEKSMLGRKYMGVERTTFLLDTDGTVQRVWQKVKPQGHAEEVLAALAG